MASLSFPLPKLKIIKASISISAPSASTLSIFEKSGRKGIKFLDSNNISMVELTIRNVSSVKWSIPDARVTSYKPKVYRKDDGFEEVLYTVGADTAKGKGGIGLVINDASEKGSKASLIPASQWNEGY